MAKAGTLTVRILSDSDGFKRGINQATSQAEQFGKKMSSVGKKMTIGLTLPLVAVGAKAAQAASDLEQSTGAIESVFGSAASKIEAFGATAEQTAGLSRREVNEMAAVVGASLKGMGFSADEAATTVIELEKRAADMAATFGGTTQEAIQAVASLLRGERDPIEKYGVSLKQADINARLAAKGLDELEGEARKQAEAQIALEALMDKTSDTAGAFAKEADTAAGAQARATAQAENMAAELGNQLLPVKIKLIETISRVVRWFSNLSNEQKKTILIVGGLVAALGPAIALVGNLITVVKGLSVAMAFLAANPIVLVIAAVVALGAALVVLYQKSETFRDIVDNAFRVVKIAALTLAKVAVQAFRFLMDVWLATVEGIVTGAAKAFGWVPGLGDKLKGAAAQVTGFRDTANAAMNSIVDKLDVQINANVNPLLQAVSRAQRALNSLTGGTVRIDGAGSGRVSGVRAHGGPVWPGGTFLVGEKGPELFTPSKGGHIVPNHELGGGVSAGPTDLSDATIRKLAHELQRAVLSGVRSA